MHGFCERKLARRSGTVCCFFRGETAHCSSWLRVPDCSEEAHQNVEWSLQGDIIVPELGGFCFLSAEEISQVETWTFQQWPVGINSAGNRALEYCTAL